MDIGTVFKWLNYPKQIDGGIKDRWFVYLGTSSILSDPQTVFIFTTTCKIELYEDGNNRSKNKNILFFDSGDYGFTKPCVLDLFFFQNNWTLDELRAYEKDFRIKGKLTNETLKRFYDKLLGEGTISTIIKKDIRRNLNNIEIYNLKIPK